MIRSQTNIERCQKCIMPGTRPGTVIEDGICNGCRSFYSRNEIDWEVRAQKWRDLVHYCNAEADSRSSLWSCVIPVSGGKDSVYQVIRAVESGLRPLCVNLAPLIRTPIGERNLDLIKKLGVDVMEITENRHHRAIFSKIGLSMEGKINWPEHVLTITAPLHVAANFSVPLVLYGENPENEYGGTDRDASMEGFDQSWFNRNSGIGGLSLEEMVRKSGIDSRQCRVYEFPGEESLSRTKVAYLGAFEPWDSYRNALIVQAHGFEVSPTVCQGSLVNYENLDNPFYGIHDFIKYAKFGFGRATDQACLSIRRGRLDRPTALDLVSKLEGRFPEFYLGVSIHDVLTSIGMTMEEFESVMFEFTNQRLFMVDKEKKTVVFDDSGFLVWKSENPFQ